MRSPARLLVLLAALVCLASVAAVASAKDDAAATAAKPSDRAATSSSGDNGNAYGRGGNPDKRGRNAADDDAPGQTGTSGPGDAPAPQMFDRPGPPAMPEATELGQTVGAVPASGHVRVKRPGDDGFSDLAAGEAIPVGSTVDATDGLVEIDAAGAGDVEQNAVVTGSAFRVDQSPTGGGMTDLTLLGGDFSDCRAASRAANGGATARAAAATRRSGGQVARGLWGAGHGRFRTRGRFGAATVRGTRWAVVDRCQSTTVKVFEGLVDVTDLSTGRVIASLGAGGRRVVH